ncbi:MAG: hypothetical protein ABEJ87_05500 [Candidatus Nanohalobium sp.]
MEQGFAVVLVAGLAVFGLMFLAGQSNFTPQQPVQGNRVVLAEKNVGTVGGARTDIRNISFRSFTVGETRGDIQAYTEDQEQISSSLFSGDSIDVKYNATQPEGGQVSFEVLGRTGKGKIWVNVNGKDVFKAATVTGATPKINFSGKNLHPGMNDIRIGTTSGGWFSSASYTLEEVEVTVNDRKFHDYQTSFKLYNHELNNYAGSNLTFTIPMDASRPDAPLKIDVNGHQVFSDKLVRSTQEIKVGKREADLTPGYNTIDFDTNGDSMYHVQDPEIVMQYLGTTRPGTLRLDFKATPGQLAYAKDGATKEIISFDYQNNLPSDHPLDISLNGNKYRVSPLNGKNTVDIKASDLKEDNTLTINSDGSFNMQNLQVVSEKVKE